MDNVDKAKRSEVMRAVKSHDTKPEMLVRRLLHKAGYRYRVHPSKLPGKPDLVFSNRKKVIFIHGCFWHGCPKHLRRPHSNTDYWQPKIDGNIERDAQHIADLQALGWDVLVVWECELKDTEKLLKALISFLE
jgi:DNA mismatch endonuclease (patch repair protein)